MGYYADFEFDLVIPADKTAAAEKALIEHLKETNHWALECEDPTSLVHLFTWAWGEEVAYEEKPTALVALASLQERGPIHFTGCVSKKWRSWEEPMLDVLAPFIEDGGTITYQGEDYDCSEQWEFMDGQRHYVSYSVYADRDIARDGDRIKEAEKLLGRVLDLIPETQVELRSDIEDFISCGSPDKES